MGFIHLVPYVSSSKSKSNIAIFHSSLRLDCHFPKIKPTTAHTVRLIYDIKTGLLVRIRESQRRLHYKSEWPSHYCRDPLPLLLPWVADLKSTQSFGLTLFFSCPPVTMLFCWDSAAGNLL